MSNMLRTTIRLVAGAGYLVLLLAARGGEAFPSIRTQFYIAYPDAVGSTIEDLPSNANHCGVCHYNFNGGGARNPYGLAVQALPNRTAAGILTLGGDDSDGDGRTNDEEIADLINFLNTPTFPGLSDDNLNLVSNVDLADIESFLTPVPAFLFSEDIDGDLSDDRLNPTAFALEDGVNRFRASQQGNSFGRDIDYLTIEVPAGHALTALEIDGFFAEPGNLAFLGLQEGTTFSVDADQAQASDLLGGSVFGENDVGSDLLPAVGALPGAEGFVPPLPAGDYTLWLNQTGPPSTVEFALVVPEPGSGASLAAGCTVMLLLARRRRGSGRP